MIPISGYIQMGLSFFEIPITVHDASYTKVSGQDVRTLSAPRPISAAVDPSGSKRLERIFGGSISDGDIGVFTTGTLHIQDLESGGALQSFVDYQGLTYRAANVADWLPQVGVNVYLCKRHLSQDNEEESA